MIRFYKILTHIRLQDLQFGCLIVAIWVYGLFGSPTPDFPGGVEVLIGGLLIVAAGSAGLLHALSLKLENPFWIGAGQVLLAYGLVIPLISSAFYGHEMISALRDIIPFFFLLMPLFFKPLTEGRNIKILIWSIVFAGCAFASRAVLHEIDFLFPADEKKELMYLANAPTVLFSSVFLMGLGGEAVLKARSIKILALGGVSFFAGVAAFSPLMLTMQRAGILYGIAALFFLFCIAVYFYPYRTFLLSVICAFLLFPFLEVGGYVIQMLSHKTHLVGLNMRAEEWNAVWFEISESIPRVLFGAGWGASFESPAVGGVRVNYTHSLLSSSLFKIGIVGTALVMVYLSGLIKVLLDTVKKYPILSVAITGPVLIDIFLYASFKSFDFGLLLLLITAVDTSASKLVREGKIDTLD